MLYLFQVQLLVFLQVLIMLLLQQKRLLLLLLWCCCWCCCLLEARVAQWQGSRVGSTQWPVMPAHSMGVVLISDSPKAKVPRLKPAQLHFYTVNNDNNICTIIHSLPLEHQRKSLMQYLLYA